MTQANGQFTPRFGTIRTGSDFFPDAIPNPDQLVTDLTSGKSIKVFGLRRIGKSSLLAETRDRLRAMGKKVIWVDMDTYDTPSKALAMILRTMNQESKNGLYFRLRNWLNKSKIIPAGLKSKVPALAFGAAVKFTKDFDKQYIDVLTDQVKDLFDDQSPDTKPIIIFDELTMLIKKTIDDTKDEESRQVVGRLNSFLGLLRSLRKSEIGVTMAVSGSVSLDWLKEEYGVRSDSVNDCLNRRIEELDRDGARRLFEMCLDAVSLPNWNEQFTEELLDLLPAYYPGVVQLAFDAISTVSTPVTTLDDSMCRKIKNELSEYYYDQLDELFNQFSTSEQDRINKLFDVLITKENGIMGGKKVLDILKCADLDNNELQGKALIRRLKSRSFIDILGDEICFSSGLVPGWHNFRNKEDD